MTGPAPPLPAAAIFGIRVHLVDMEGALQVLRGLLASGGSHWVATVHTAMLAAIRREGALRELINSASLVTPDGYGILLIGRILGIRFPARVAGADLVHGLCDVCARDGYRVFLLGAAPGVADAAAAALRTRHPGVVIAGTHHGYFIEGGEDDVVRQIGDARPDLLLVGMGFPRQERWMATHARAIRIPLSMGVGGTLDVLAGRFRRAPLWMQRAGLEWLYRLLQDPRRWRVAATLPGVVLAALRDRLAGR